MNLKGNLTSKGLQGSIGKSRMQGILGTNPAAIPITVDNALSLSSTNPVQNKVITAAITNRLWSDEVKTALLQIVEKVAYVDDQGQTYYDALYDALYPPVGLDSIGAVFDSSATIYNTDTLDDLKQYLTVTAYYSSGDSEVVDSYTLSGSMDAGTQTITVSYGGKTTTFTVTIIALGVDSIDAVFTQGSATIYDTDSLDTLKQYLTVTATYSDSSTVVVADYTLSGTLATGTSTITVSYGGKTDTFDVTVTHYEIVGWYYPFNGSLTSAGTEDFGLSGTVEYVTGVNGQAYYKNIANTPYGIDAINLTDIPNLAPSTGGGTISFWFKSTVAKAGWMFSAQKTTGTSTSTYTMMSAPQYVKSGWSVAMGQGVAKKLGGTRIFWDAEVLLVRIINSAKTYAATYRVTPPSTFDSTEWHHFALTTETGKLRFFIDGEIIFSVDASYSLGFESQVVLGGSFEETSGSTSQRTSSISNSMYFDDFLVAEYCKWTSDFDPYSIVY